MSARNDQPAFSPFRLRLPKPPPWLVVAFVAIVVLSWLPLSLIWLARASTSGRPRIHIFHDMGHQPRYGPQTAAEVFADGAALRVPPVGTVARGMLDDDDHYWRGWHRAADPGTGRTQIVFFDSLPARVPLTMELLRRGRQRFDIFCAPCHGLDGHGGGPVDARALETQESRWVRAASLHTDLVRGRPDGHIFNTITSGIRNMPSYAQQIPPDDRWAIVAYVRALQLSQNAPLRFIPAEKLPAQP